MRYKQPSKFQLFTIFRNIKGIIIELASIHTNKHTHEKIIVDCPCGSNGHGLQEQVVQESSITIGMPENDFKRVNRSAELMLANDDGTSIYRIISTSFIPKPEPFTFFYFYQGKLTRFVKSDRLDDYKFIR